MRQALEVSLTRRGVTTEQFAAALQLAKEAGERMAATYGETVGRTIEPAEFARIIFGTEGTGRLLLATLREVTGRADLYRELD
ncbi:hypothetical protein H9Y04_35200 [Streptomyces sp. TRM66268-LWL]|uniref:Uncharacterized protein n=1 Tax=Streptomyces polyasparticus TaxID=2767826 RepID=A0ABR7STC1_9ACTN|nr:hypothetical protein [Streptomyces polyasparticus]MBC9717791.1 hypothetical protein [Streptomyces polyasparticus]